MSSIQQLANSQPSPSIAAIAGSPDVGASDTPSAAEFTTKYGVAILANTLRANADQALTLIQMLSPHSPTE